MLLLNRHLRIAIMVVSQYTVTAFDWLALLGWMGLM